MSKPLSIRAIRENILLSLLTQGARSVGDLKTCAGFTRHDSRVRRLLSELGDAEHVVWGRDGEWRITDRGLRRLKKVGAA